MILARAASRRGRLRGADGSTLMARAEQWAPWSHGNEGSAEHG
jgi:hypothetical protein